MIKRIIYTLFFLSSIGNLIAQTPSIGGYNVYYGHLHNHNAIGPSYAVGSHDDAYNYARNVARLDYFGTSNHWIYLTDPEWDSIKAVSDKYNEDGVFTAFRGFEYESIGGDLTIINTEDYSSIVSDSLCPWLEIQNGLAFINHPYGVHYALFDSTPPCDRVVGMELFNKTDGFNVYYYAVNYFADANLRGWKIGASGSDDNHQGTWGTRTDWRMAILSKHLSRPELFEAMRARRFYSTLDKNLALSFKIDSSEMGSTMGGDSVSVRIQASDDKSDLFTRVQLFRNDTVRKTWNIITDSVDLTFPITVGSDEFYYVKVTQADGDEAISSPVYITTRPVCSITFPKNNSHFTSPRLITITAEASDADGTVVRVEFFVNGDSICSDTLAPYSAEYTIPAGGYYEVTAKARDDLGSWGTSSSCFFTTGDYAKSVSSRIANGEDDDSGYGCGSPWGWRWELCTTDDCSVFLDREGYNDATAGLRFTDLFIPQGIKIENAYIQFTAKEVDTGYCKLHIRGHDVDNSTSAEDALNEWEPVTSAEVIWEPPDWITIGAAGTDQRTPDLSSIIQEIVNRPGYTINSAITIIFTGEGTGQRTAVSYECTQDLLFADCDTFNTDAAATLTVFYSTFPTISSIMAPESDGADVHLYPNPVMDLLTVETFHPGFHYIEITTLNGQLLYSTIMEESTLQLDLSSFQKGVYFITIRSRDYVRTEKIIKL
jgi:hypothetical protein